MSPTPRSPTLAVAALGWLYVMSSAPLPGSEPVVVGEHVAVELETPHPYPAGLPAPLGSGPRLVWRDVVSFPGSTYIAVHFARFELAPGDFVIVRPLGAAGGWRYEGTGRHGLGTSPEGFFATHVKADRVAVELYSTGVGTGWGYRIDFVGRGYSAAEIEAFWSSGEGEAMGLPTPRSWDDGALPSVCAGDESREAACYRPKEREVFDASRPVARLLLNGRVHCTGFLVGCEGHLLTAEHCIDSQAALDAVDFELLAQGINCGVDCREALACPGVIEASGGTLVAVDAELDLALVIPDTSTANGRSLPKRYGYLELRPAGPELGERIYVPQYPGGWGKRIALESTYPSPETAQDRFARIVSLSEPGCQGDVEEIGYYADTRGGSSGAPVIGYRDHQVVGMHHCAGDARCFTGDPEVDEPNRGIPSTAILEAFGDYLPACASATVFTDDFESCTLDGWSEVRTDTALQHD